MRGTESARKVASLTVIGLVLVASFVLWQASPSWLLPAWRLPAAVSLIQSPFRLEPEPVPRPFGVDPEPVQSRLRVESEAVRSRFGVDAEWSDGATQLGGASGSQEMRTPLAARALPLGGDAPIVVPHPLAAPEPGPVSRALLTTRREASDAFRTAGRVVRSLF